MNFFNTSGVDSNNLHPTMDVTMDIGLAAFLAGLIPSMVETRDSLKSPVRVPDYTTSWENMRCKGD